MRAFQSMLCGGLLTATLFSAVTPTARADVTIKNGKANGSVKIYAKKGDAAPQVTQNITNMDVPFEVLIGPEIDKPGINPNTKANMKFVSKNKIIQFNETKNGNYIAWEDPELLSLVVPTSDDATSNMTIEGTLVGSSMQYSGSWFNSDAGVAQRLRWYDATNPGDPILLTELTYVGGGSGSISALISLPGGIEDNLMLRQDAVVTSVPEPASLALVAAGALFKLRRRR